MGAGISETRRPAVLEAAMANLSSDDQPEKSVNGTIGRLNETSPPASMGSRDEQTLADTEQTLADSDQTLADSDQTSGERDQSSADSDQAASDRDQAASDRDLAHGVDPRDYEASREIRRRTALQREQTAGARLESAQERDATAAARDLAAEARDQAAAVRDLAMAQRDADDTRDDALAAAGAEMMLRAAEQRNRARNYRAQAAEHRAQAARDREAAASDREQGARDRLQALADREALARALAITEVDPLTGARARAAGLTELEHEIDRSRRTGSTLVIVYVDVVGLKRRNDSAGHDAGDRLLKHVVALITEHLRPYDLVVRLGGDEFLCAMSNMTHADAHQRFSAIASALAASREAGAIRTGYAELTGTEAAKEFVARADSELISRRGETDASGRVAS
jgi:diguanylate cyclase (GGDEF)-like protein